MSTHYTSTPPEIEPSSTDVHQQFAEVWAMVRRRPGLVASCLLIACVLGALYYLKAPRTYESFADILIVTKHYSISGNDETESPVYEKTMETHAEMICQPLIVGRAVEEYDLAALPSLVDEEDPVGAIIYDLTAHMKNENATIMQVTYRSSSPEDAQAVVAAVSATYNDYLNEENEETGQETASIIAQASTNLLEQLRKNQTDHQSFQMSAPLMWREGRGINIHHERQGSIEQSRQELMNARTVLTAKLEALNVIITSGEVSREALYFEAMKALQLDEEDTSWRAYQMAERERFAEREAVRNLSSLLVSEYVRLKVEHSNHLDEYGAGHPMVESVAKRKEEIKTMLDGIFQNQSELAGAILNTSEENSTDDTDYVAIYMQKVKDELSVLDRQIAALDEAFVHEQELANQMQEYLLRDQAFRNDRENTKQLFDVVVTRLKEVNLMNSFGGDTMTIVAPAKLGEQVAPRLLFVFLGSITLGMLGGCGLAWLRDRSEDMFRSLPEIRQSLGVPVIGRIPQMITTDMAVLPQFKEFDPTLFALHNEDSPVAEAFRSVRTSLFFSTAGQKHKVIQITSPLPSDGKSTVTANLGVAIAKSGKRVLVIDADFRRPALTQMFGIKTDIEHGLAGIIAGNSSLEAAIVNTEVDNLYFLPVCKMPTQPSEILSTPEFEALLEDARDSYDTILIDTPPVLPVTDPCVIAARVDGVLLTIRIRRGVQEAAKRAMEMLRDVDANVVGIVANGWQPQSSLERSSYGYGYGYGYTRGTYPANGNGNGNGAAEQHESEKESVGRVLTPR